MSKPAPLLLQAMFMPLCANHRVVINFRRRYRRDYGGWLDMRDLGACSIMRGYCRIQQSSVFGTGSDAIQQLARQLFQLRGRRIDRAGADVAGVLDHAVEPAIDIDNGAFA